jgi:hypothetical protein
MNDEHNTQDPAQQRLARDLRSAAGSVPLASGSEVAVVAHGRRRRHRRRQANAIVLVAATGIGTAFVIRQLARNGDSSVATDSLPSTEVAASVPQSAVPAPTTPSDSTAAPETTPGSVPLGTAAGSPDFAPAQIVDSNMVWNVVEPDSTQAVAYGDLRSAATSGASLPGVVLATAPGRNDNYTPQMWRSDDGISWTQIDVNPPFGGLGNTRFTGDSVYAVGTAPGIAGSQANPLRFGVSHDDGATWDQIELPVDTNAGHDLPFVKHVSSTATVYPLDQGAVVWLDSGAELDWDAIAAQLGVQATDSLGAYSTRDGVLVPVDPNCQPSSARNLEMKPVFGVETTSAVQSEIDGCEQRLVGWGEIGVPQETVDLAFNHTSREFRVVGSDVTELDVPAGVTGNYGGSAQDPLFTSDDELHWYRMGADGVLVATDAPTGDGYPLGSNRDTDFVQTSPSGGTYGGGYDTGVGASTAGGPWVYADWSNLAGDGRLGFSMGMGVTSAGVVEVLQVAEDTIAAQGGASVTIDGYTISRATGHSPITIVDAAGQPVDLSHVWYGKGGVIITDSDGNQVATLDGPTFQSVLSDPGASPPEDYLVAVSADGVHVSVESIADLLGVDPAVISSVPRISAAGNTTVIAVTLKERNAQGVPRQLVLVGTPRG